MGKPLSGSKILVIEGNLIIARVCLKVLVVEGFAVDIATNCSQAQELIQETEYDLILLALRVPVINGIGFYQQICKKYPGLAEKVVFTDGEVAGADTQAFLQSCGRPFLPKPYTPDELLTVIKEVLRRMGK